MLHHRPLGPVSIYGALLWVLLLLAWPGSAAAATREYQLKAAFLYNFTKFIEWPETRFAGSDSPIVIGVLGENPFNGELTHIVSGRLVNGRPVAVHIVKTAAEASEVHLLFVPVDQEPLFASIRRDLDTRNVVTVGETPEFDALGGVIRFVVQAEKIRFAVHVHSDRPTSVRISAHLLKLAVAVEN